MIKYDKLTANEKLDIILKRLSSPMADAVSPLTIAAFIDVQNAQGTVHEIRLITAFLAEENYVTEKNELYKITFRGKQFIEGGGFKGDHCRKTISTALQSSATLAIVVGTLFGGCYGIFEVLKFFRIIHQC